MHSYQSIALALSLIFNLAISVWAFGRYFFPKPETLIRPSKDEPIWHRMVNEKVFVTPKIGMLVELLRNRRVPMFIKLNTSVSYDILNHVGSWEGGENTSMDVNLSDSTTARRGEIATCLKECEFVEKTPHHWTYSFPAIDAENASAP